MCQWDLSILLPEASASDGDRALQQTVLLLDSNNDCEYNFHDNHRWWVQRSDGQVCKPAELIQWGVTDPQLLHVLPLLCIPARPAHPLLTGLHRRFHYTGELRRQCDAHHAAELRREPQIVLLEEVYKEMVRAPEESRRGSRACQNRKRAT